MTTVALVAAKDAEASIAATVTALSALPAVDEVWVVDDGSTDATAEAAGGAGAHVVRLDDNVGKGGALAAGCAATAHADRYLLADADLGATAAGLAPLLDAPSDVLAVGVLPSAGKKGGFGSVKRFARAGIRRAVGVELDAPLSGQRAVDGPVLRSLVLAPRFGVEVGMTIDVARAGVPVVEVPVEVDHRHTGRRLPGFEHRARQGYDIAGALVARLTTPRQRLSAVLVTALAVVVGLSAMSWLRAAPGGEPLPDADRVVLFAFDRLALRDLERDDLPALRDAAADGAAAALSVRTTDRRSLDRRAGPERPSAIDVYASLGASARVRAPEGLALAPERGLGGAMRAARRLARNDDVAALPGGLGGRLHEAGKTTGLVAGAQLVGRNVAGFPAAAAIADANGRIDHVDTSSGLLEATTAPTGVRASVPAFVVATASALREADVVVVDPGETARAADIGGDRDDALRRTDAILAGVRGVLPPRTLLVVFAPTPRGQDWELTPLLVVGAEARGGVVASSATRRAALAVVTDIAPTVLHALGTTPTREMTGSVLRRASGELDVARFDRMSADGAARTRFFLGAAVAYTVAAIAFYLAVIAALFWRVMPSIGRWLRLGTCIAAAYPLALLLTGAIQHWLRFGGESPLLLSATCVAIGVVIERLRGVAPVYACAAAAVAIIAVDVAATGPIHTSSLLGYSLQTTGRFYGLPNASFAVFAASLLFVAVAAAGGLRPATPVRAAAGTAVLAAGTVFVAAPWLGNDVGGTLALAPVAAALAWAFSGGAFSRRNVLVGAALVVVGLGAVLGLEAALGSGTHLARAAGGSLGTTLRHRVNANWGLLVDQWWGFLVFVLAGVGIAASARGLAAAEAPPRSPLRAGLTAAFVLSLLAFVANDSGPVVSVLCVVVAVPALALRAIDRARYLRRPPSTIS